jgi:uncharacterized protein YjbI with pentapeptide repeats
VPPSLVSFKRRMQGHVQQGGDFKGLDLRSAQAFQSAWENVTLDACKASMVDFRGSRWVNGRFLGTTFYGASFNAATLHGMEFVDSDGEQASFQGAVLRNVVFRNCRLAYASFMGATLDGVLFSDCNLHGADLDLAEATGVSYLGCNLWGAKAAFGCGFWNSSFDEETCNRFAAILARIHPDQTASEALIAMSGENTYRAVCRLMDTKPDTDEPEF